MRLASYLRVVGTFIIWSMSGFAYGADLLISTAGLEMALPPSWNAKFEQTKLPTGQWMERWVRDPVKVGEYSASPGLIVVVSPIAKDGDLLLLTQQFLAGPPHRVKLAADTECIKCVKMKFKQGERFFTSISPAAPASCVEQKTSVQAECAYTLENPIGLTIEPSWAHQFEKDAPYGKSYVLVMHAIVDEKLVDFTFIYPKEAAPQIQPEIARIFGSLRKRIP